MLNPTLDQLPRSQLDLVVAGTSEGVLMVESEAKELSEETMLGAVTFGHRSFQPVINAIIELAETCAKEPWSAGRAARQQGGEIEARLREAVGPQLEAAYRERGKQDAQRPARRRQGRRVGRAVRRRATSARWR